MRLALYILLFFPVLVSAQHNLGDGNLNACAGTLYDNTGTSTSGYDNSLNITETYCSSAGNCISVTFGSFDLESCCDFLNIYDGTTVGDPLIGTYSGATLAGQTIESSSGCLTFNFTSDGSVVGSGWDASISCAACPTCTDLIQNGSETGVDCGGTCPSNCPCENSTIGSLPFSQTGMTTAGFGDDYSSADACGSTYMNGDDYLFSYTPSADECIDITLTNTATYVGLFVFDGCPDDPCAFCINSATSSGGNPSLSGVILTSGTEYFIGVSTSPAPQSTPFDISVTSVACSGTTGGDECANATPISQGAGNINTQSDPYTADTPDNLTSIFCGSVENNQWFSFVASATTEVFNFSSVTTCADGIQAEVYDVTVSGCACSGFTSMSNCWNPGSATNGSVTATGLTIGATYLLMVDGQAGDLCDYQLDGWEDLTVLPVTLISFTGENKGTYNALQWITATEENNDYFTVERSTDGVNFEELAVVDAAGFSNVTLVYNARDDHPPPGVVSYYRLSQTDYDGSREYFSIIAIENDGMLDFSLIPNPASSEVIISGDLTQFTDVGVEVYSVVGAKVLDKKMTGLNANEPIDLSSLAAGSYTFLLRTDGAVSVQRLVIE